MSLENCMGILKLYTNKIIKEVEFIFYSYLWNNGRDKIKRSFNEQNVDRGGLRMVNLEKFIIILKIEVDAWNNCLNRISI